MKKFFAILLVTLLVVSMAACKPGTEEKKEGLTFGWSVYDMSNPFFIPMDEGVKAKCTELGITLLPTHDNKGDATEMVTGATALIDQGIDALIISPFHPASLSTVVAKAEEAGIPVIVVDIGTGGCKVDAFIQSDMRNGGQQAGDYFLKIVGDYEITSKNVAIIKVETSATEAQVRGEGFKDQVVPAGYKVVQEEHADSSKDKAYTVMLDYIATYGSDLAAVFCENDEMALGAAAAIDEKGLTGKILVFGYDGNQAAVDACKAGSMHGTAAQDPFGMGAYGVELAKMICDGKALPATEYTNADGNKFYRFPMFMIGKDGQKVG